LNKTLRFGVLDQAPVPEGSTAATALNNSVELAQHVEALGFTRFWMSEHHAMQTLACSAPEVVLARVGAATRSIRIGSGGIMLPHYAPMKVAEVFRTLHAMYPDRVDLGVGRAPGGGPIETLAWLGQNEGFPAGNRFGTIRLSPEMPGGPTVWMLGSSLWGAHAAAQWGLPYAFAHFFSPVATREAVESYRRTFQPSPLLAKPRAVIAAGVIVAPTDEEAAYLHSSVRLLQVRIRQGDRRPVAAPDDALRELAQQQSGLPLAPAGALEEGEFPRYFTGSPETVKRNLSSMANSLGLEEILVNTITHSHEARLRSYTMLAEAFQH
jgi:alkanesulfonate monooxygenase SsuD/methylene tetrahydromethanopterin reductase-like flavin-dependent oxidoreductase (luciferase family)